MSKQTSLSINHGVLPSTSGAFGLRVTIKTADLATRRLRMVVDSMDIPPIVPQNFYSHLFRNSHMIRRLHADMMDGIGAMIDMADQYLSAMEANGCPSSMENMAKDLEKMQHIVDSTKMLHDTTVDYSINNAWTPFMDNYHRIRDARAHQQNDLSAPAGFSAPKNQGVRIDQNMPASHVESNENPETEETGFEPIMS